jgi:hypothetical protein
MSPWLLLVFLVLWLLIGLCRFLPWDGRRPSRLDRVLAEHEAAEQRRRES